MLKFTIDNKIELIAEKDQNNTYVFTNFSNKSLSNDLRN